MRIHRPSRVQVIVLAMALVAGGAGLAVSLSRQGAQTRTSIAAGEWTCPMHPDVHERHPGKCPICGMTLVKTNAKADAEAHDQAHESRAEAANPARPGVVAPAPSEAPDPRASVEIDARRQQLLGVRIAAAETASLGRSIRVPGVVKFDESRWTDVTLRLEGYVRDLYVDRTGQAVRRGQPLFSLFSPDVAVALAEYRLAVTARDALGASVSAESRAQAERLVDAARLRLARWDVSGDQIDASSSGGETRTVFRSPVSGIVMEKSVVRGMRAMPGEVLYRIVDPSRLWVEASIYEPDLAAIRVGQRGAMTFGALPGERFSGRVLYIAPELDSQARTIPVRFELANPGGRLKAGMFATVSLDVPLGTGLVVPSDAVLDSGRRQLVFVSAGDGYFEPREVVVGQRVDGRTQILSGLREGERVAESAAFFIDSESQLRAAAQGYDATTAAPVTAAAERLSIVLAWSPDPPKAGPVTLTATVRQADGTPVTDADVAVVFAMAAMPTMNMPAMRADASLAGISPGTYRGTVDVPMAGRWDVTTTVLRAGQRLGAAHTTVIAR